MNMYNTTDKIVGVILGAISIILGIIIISFFLWIVITNIFIIYKIIFMTSLTILIIIEPSHIDEDKLLLLICLTGLYQYI